jgi:hypothetical protein
LGLLAIGRPQIHCLTTDSNDPFVTQVVSQDLSDTVPITGFLSMGLSAVAEATKGASASANVAHTLQLTSITVPDDFAGDLSGSEVVFDSGLVIPVTRNSSGNPIPEPGSIALLGSSLFLLLARVMLRNRRPLR